MKKCKIIPDLPACELPITNIEDGLISEGGQYRATNKWYIKNQKYWGILNAEIPAYRFLADKYPIYIELDYEFFERRDKQKNRK